MSDPQQLQLPIWRGMDTAPRGNGQEVLLMVEMRAGVRGKFLVGHYMSGGHCIEDHPPIDEGWYFWNGHMSEISRESFELACQAAGMQRTEACHPEDEFRFCRSDVWRGDLIAFALAVVKDGGARGALIELLDAKAAHEAECKALDEQPNAPSARDYSAINKAVFRLDTAWAAARKAMNK